ncbi:MAG TPA: cysteine peptidase family C39 domain-containing protein [Polyangiaceae bacterium]|nr:cysteine peptidase family C39 domain-containing protein [Polyangiaceae bacterium]
MTNEIHHALCGLLALASVCACASYKGASREVSAGMLAEQPGWVRLENVQLVRQRGTKDCGAAALATVFGYLHPGGPAALGRAAIDASLREQPGRGLAAGQLRDYARARGFDAFVIKGSMEDLQHEVEAGRPPIVGMYKPLSSGKVLAHYEVFVGFHREREQILTLDPARGLREFGQEGFLEEWRAAGQVSIVVLPKDGAPSARLWRLPTTPALASALPVAGDGVHGSGDLR